MTSLSDYLSGIRCSVDSELDKLLPAKDVYPSSVHDAIRYCVFNGGKRLRPAVAMAVGEIYGFMNSSFLRTASGIELIHSCSLILDDLPCMDNAVMRRGKKTCHLVYGESTAVLASVALLNLGYQVIFEQVTRAETIKRIGVLITQSVGTFGLIGGQTVDLESEGKDVSFETIEYIHSHKTGALFTASALLGGIAAGASEKELTALEMYAKNLGLAFQITDDLLDIIGDEKETGKDKGKDRDKDKATFVSHAGVAGARKLLSELIDFSINSLSLYGSKAERLIQIARYVKERKK